MSEKNTKALRKEIKDAVKELLPTHLSIEHHDLLMIAVNKRLDQLEKQVKETLKRLEEDHKNTMGYLVRNLTSGHLNVK